MNTVVAFPAARRAAPAGQPVAGGSAQIIILPVVRIERHGEPAVAAKPARMPRKRVAPVASGSGRRAR